MTRRPVSAIEKRLEALEDEFGTEHNEILIVHEDPRDGTLTDREGDVVDRENHGADCLVVFEQSVVMEPDQALDEDREILGPAEGTEVGVDLVKVPMDG